MVAFEYRYTIITRQNSEACDLDHHFWLNHPDWEFVVRTNQRYPGKNGVWITGGGATLVQAIESAEFGIRHLLFGPEVSFFGGAIVSRQSQQPLTGSESPTVIKNARPE